jgi:hypothetical protein
LLVDFNGHVVPLRSAFLRLGALKIKYEFRFGRLLAVEELEHIRLSDNKPLRVLF